jgi:hypothetical protein
LAHPKSVAQACDEVRLRSSRKPLFGLLIRPHIAKPSGQAWINPSSPPDKTPHVGRFRLAIAQCERVANRGGSSAAVKARYQAGMGSHVSAPASSRCAMARACSVTVNVLDWVIASV